MGGGKNTTQKNGRVKYLLVAVGVEKSEASACNIKQASSSKHRSGMTCGSKEANDVFKPLPTAFPQGLVSF